QSHTYTRTHELFNDFVTELVKADRVIMLPIYAAREENISGVTSLQLVEAIEKKGIETKFFETPEASAKFIKESVGPDEVVVVMGAGPVTEVAKLLTE
ncbi:UDP-N-acetylmuramate--L-alanine ligase, partial [Candidatus Falkowbacteria bacterium CG10_big_fil_rev_8_21_14_0_10_37_18]